jgi:hypothetical protein
VGEVLGDGDDELWSRSAADLVVKRHDDLEPAAARALDDAAAEHTLDGHR